jgi:hypothetical protein
MICFQCELRIVLELRIISTLIRNFKVLRNRPLLQKERKIDPHAAHNALFEEGNLYEGLKPLKQHWREMEVRFNTADYEV